MASGDTILSFTAMTSDQQELTFSPVIDVATDNATFSARLRRNGTFDGNPYDFEVTIVGTPRTGATGANTTPFPYSDTGLPQYDLVIKEH